MSFLQERASYETPAQVAFRGTCETSLALGAILKGMVEQRGYETITHDDLFRVTICPHGGQWLVTIHSLKLSSPAETGLDIHEHGAASLEDAKEWAAEQLARIWLPAIEERQDLRKYEALTWIPIDC